MGMNTIQGTNSKNLGLQNKVKVATAPTKASDKYECTKKPEFNISNVENEILIYVDLLCNVFTILFGVSLMSCLLLNDSKPC